MTDPSQDQPSEEEIRAYLQQIRDADPAAIVVQAYRMLAEGAELKLGRADARLLIDLMDAVVGAADGRVDPQLVGQMREGVRQLQAAQVQAEREQAGDAAAAPVGAPGAPPAGAPGGPRGAPGGPGAAQRPQPQPGPGQPGGSGGQAGESSVTDRLWIPGRGPRP